MKLITTLRLPICLTCLFVSTLLTVPAFAGGGASGGLKDPKPMVAAPEEVPILQQIFERKIDETEGLSDPPETTDKSNPQE